MPGLGEGKILEGSDGKKTIKINAVRYNKFYFLIPFIQIVFYIFLYEITNHFAHKMGLVYSRGVAWGISAQLYTYVYIAIILVSHALGYFLKKGVLLIAVISSIVFASIVAPVLDSYPYRGGLVILIGVGGIFINYIFLSKYGARHSL